MSVAMSRFLASSPVTVPVSGWILLLLADGFSLGTSISFWMLLYPSGLESVVLMRCSGVLCAA